jgi:hypothetical protein
MRQGIATVKRLQDAVYAVAGRLDPARVTRGAALDVLAEESWCDADRLEHLGERGNDKQRAEAKKANA